MKGIQDHNLISSSPWEKHTRTQNKVTGDFLKFSVNKGKLLKKEKEV